MPIGSDIGSFAEGLSKGLLSGAHLASTIQQMKIAQQEEQRKQEEFDYIKKHRILENNLKLFEMTDKVTKGLSPEKADVYWNKLKEQVGNDDIMTNLIDAYRNSSADRQKELNDIIKGLTTSVNNSDWDNFDMYYYRLGMATDFGKLWEAVGKRRMEAVTQQGQKLFMDYSELLKEIKSNPSKYVTNGVINEEGLKAINAITELRQRMRENPEAVRLWAENYVKQEKHKLKTYINPKTGHIITINETEGQMPPEGYAPMANFSLKQESTKDKLLNLLSPEQQRKAAQIEFGLLPKSGEAKEKTMTEYRHWFDIASKEAMKRVFGNSRDQNGLSALASMIEAYNKGNYEEAEMIKKRLEGSMTAEQYRDYLNYRDEFFSSAPGVPDYIRSIYAGSKPKGKSTTPVRKTVDDYFRRHK